jgi:two-component system response regulator DegU
MPEIRILIVCSRPLMVKGIRQALEQEPDFMVIGEATCEEALHVTSSLKPDIAIVENAMPGFNGIEVTKKLKFNSPCTAVLVLSDVDSDEFVLSLVKSGAAGYLLTNISGYDIINVIRAVIQGKSHPFKIEAKIPKAGSTAASYRRLLGKRQMEVLQLVGKALTNQEIADKLGLSLHTIEAHLRHVFRKLKVDSRTEAVLYALKQGWITLDDNP